MKWEHIVRWKYREDLLTTYMTAKKATEFFTLFAKDAVQRALEAVVEDVVPTKGSDVHLEAFLSTGEALKFIGFELRGVLTMLVYPSKGEIEKYRFTKDPFFTNAHQNPDPIVVQDIHPDKGILLNTKRPPGYVLLTRDLWIPNEISSALLFKKNPFENLEDYDGIEEFLRYQASERKSFEFGSTRFS